MQSPRKPIVVLLTLFLAISGVLPRIAMAQTDGPPEFIRFLSNLPGQGTLATSVRHYRHTESGRVVALVSAVHVADPSYYQALQRELDSHDLVLFERVGTDDEEAVASREALSQLARLQEEIAGFLEFTHQMEGIDYRRQNLRHADMSLAEFEAALGQRGGEAAAWQLQMARWVAPLLRMVISLLEQFDAEQAMMANLVRWQLGQMLGDLDTVLEQMNLDGENPDDLIIGVRNQRAWDMLEAALPEGHQRIAIFYGAAHMPDFQRRLQTAGWELETTRWIPAWRIPVPAAQPAPETRAKPGLEFDI